ncbi:hypothetical protein GCM10023192_38480 [Amycolatopsis samaneae]
MPGPAGNRRTPGRSNAIPVGDGVVDKLGMDGGNQSQVAASLWVTWGQTWGKLAKSQVKPCV